MIPDDEAGDPRRTHLLRGVLEMATLATLAAVPTHAYDVVERLRAHGFATVGYGTVYPLVTRLRRQGLVLQESEPSPTGPPRNVLRVTAAGHEALADWRRVWAEVTAATDDVLAASDAASDAALRDQATAR